MHWLQVNNKNWIKYWEVLPMAIFITSILTGWILKLLDIIPSVWDVGIYGLIFFPMIIIGHYIFYNFSGCSRCGYLISKYKNGKNKPINLVYKEMSMIEICPKCGNGKSAQQGDAPETSAI